MQSRAFLRTILGPLAIAVSLALSARLVLHVYSISSASMMPTLQPGDQIIVTPYFRSAPQRGHVVVFKSPQTGEFLVKRIVAIPGDLVDSRLGRLRLGGYTVPESYVLDEAATGAIEAQIVPPDSYYVLGDNRHRSLDSRSWGAVPAGNIVGRAHLVLWTAPWTVAGSEGVARASSSPAESVFPTSSSGRLFKWVE